MIWILCAGLSIFLMVLGAYAYVKTRRSIRMVKLLLLLFVATFFAYFPLFLLNYEIFISIIGDFVNILHIIVIDSDLMQAYGTLRVGIHSKVCSNAYMLLLGILNVAMPAVSAATAFSVIKYYFSSLRLFFINRHKKKLFVFSELNSRSLALAQSLSGMDCDIIFAGKNDEMPQDEGCNRFVFEEEKITEINLQVKKERDIYLFCISENEDESLEDALQLINRFAKLEEKKQKRIHIYEIAYYNDYSVYFDSAEKGLLDVQCVNEAESVIYHLLDRYPLYRFAESQIHVLLYGLSKVNIAAFKAVLWCGQLSGFELKISIVGNDIQNDLDDLKLSFPGLFTERYNVNVYDCKNRKEMNEAIGQYCTDANYIIVSDVTDHDTINAGIEIRRLMYKRDKSFSYCPPIFCYIKGLSKCQIVSRLTTPEYNSNRKMSYDLIPFGTLSDVYNYKNMIDSDLEGLAKSVHLAYEEIFSDGKVDVDRALRKYNMFEVNKRSNRANALHIKYKLNLLGLNYTDEPSSESVNFSDYYTPEKLKRLSVSEHNRWMAFLETEGWTTASRENVYAYKASDISKGRHNCPLLKLHPYICEYEKLKELSEELEGKDTTVYDEELILRIPDIVGDKWNITGRKNKIRKAN